MQLSWNEIRDRARTFSRDWQGVTDERAEAQTFWNEFFTVFGVSRRRFAYFEKPVKKQDDARGRIDLWWKGVLLAEHKTAGRDLDSAYKQAAEYFPGLKDEELPRYVVVSDFARIRLYDLEQNTQIEFLLADLPKRVKEFGFMIGAEPVVYKEEDPANRRAAELMAKLHDAIKDVGYDKSDLERFMVRILFCLFADDAAIFERGIFRDYIERRTKEDGSDLGRALNELFEILDTKEDKRQETLDEDLAAFPHVNGALFSGALKTVSFNNEMRKALLKTMSFDWSKISPAVCGAMCQGVMNQAERRMLGAHYTSETNILKVIGPLFLDDLKAELAKIISTKADQKNRLEKFQLKLRTIKLLDPACGCGNFLVVSYRELRLLELEAIKTIRSDNQTLSAFDVRDTLSIVNVDQMYGIEIEEFPARVAEVALWLTDHQMNQLLADAFGGNFARIPLVTSATIVNSNALLIDWKEVISPEKLSYILGNPPFIGQTYQSKDQKAEVAEVLNGIKKTGVLDYVSCWFGKAASYMIENQHIKCALVTTNSITQGEQVGILWGYLYAKGVRINFAHRTFQWSNDARGIAGVHCVIIGFALEDAKEKWIFDYSDNTTEPTPIRASRINAYLIDAPDAFIDSRSTPLSKDAPKMISGGKPTEGGNLLLTLEEKAELIKIHPGVEKYIRPFSMGNEFINGIPRFCLWLVDVDPSELRTMPEVVSRVEAVRQMRLQSPKIATKKIADTPAIFGEIRTSKTKYIAVPKVSSERRRYIPIGYLNPEVVAGDKLFFLESDSLYVFGILTSGMHMTWMRHVAGRLKSDYSYSNTLTYNNFSWPEDIGNEGKLRVEVAAKAVLDARAQFPNATLADLYDPNTMPPVLLKAHQVLDKAVDQCYRKEPFKTEAERMAFLFERYQILVAKELASIKPKKVKNK